MAAKRNHPGEVNSTTLTLWSEALFGVELLLLHAAPVYYGFGIPRGDSSGRIIPGFLGDCYVYLVESNAWLRRIGYRPYFSGIGLNAECPNRSSSSGSAKPSRGHDVRPAAKST